MAKQPLEIWGLNEINEVLEKLPKQYGHVFVTNTYADAARKTFLKEARSRVPVYRGKPWKLSGRWADSRSHDNENLKKSLGIIKYTNRKVPGVMVGPRSREVFKKGGAKYDGWYTHMIEHGHYRTDKNGNRLYYVAPQPFMRPAFDNNRHEFVDMIGRVFGKVATKFIKKITKRMTKSR